MQVTLENNAASYRIHSYDSGHITIAVPKLIEPVPDGHPDESPGLSMWRDTLTHSLVLTPEQLIRNWGADQFSDLKADHFSQLSSLNPEILLFGSGQSLLRPPAAIISSLIDAGIGVEVMDTGAACRTYNILMNDGRQVAAALMII